MLRPRVLQGGLQGFVTIRGSLPRSLRASVDSYQVRGVSALEKRRNPGCVGVKVLACKLKNKGDALIGGARDVGQLSLQKLCQARISCMPRTTTGLLSKEWHDGHRSA